MEDLLLMGEGIGGSPNLDEGGEKLRSPKKLSNPKVTRGETLLTPSSDNMTSVSDLSQQEERLLGVEEKLLNRREVDAESIQTIVWENEKRTWISAVSTCTTLSILIFTFILTCILFAQNLTVEDKVDRMEKKMIARDLFIRSILITERNSKQAHTIAQDQLSFVIGLQCGLIQMMSQGESKSLSSLMQVCAEMESATVGTINKRIAELETDMSVVEGDCLSDVDERIAVGEDYCVDDFPLTQDSLSETGLLPEPLIDPASDTSFLGSTVVFPGGEVGDDSDFEVPIYVSNPLLGPFYSRGPYVYGASDAEPMVGLFVSFTYSTKRNIDYVNVALGGGGFGVTPASTYPNDGALFIDLNVRNSHSRSSPRETFGKVTAVLESSVFDGLGHMFADRETVVLSGKHAIAGWTIANGLDSVQSLPTLTRDVIASSTTETAFGTSLVSPAHIMPYVEESTGKRFFLIAARDTVETSDPGEFFCDTVGDSPVTCGGFISVDRDALWQSSPTSAVSRVTPYGLNNDLEQSTPGSFVPTRGRSIILSTTSISYLFAQQDACHFAHYFLAHVLNRSDLVDPIPGYDFELPALSDNVEKSARVSVYQYENLLLLFNLSSRWLDVGDILYNTELEGAGMPPTVVDRNKINRPNLDVNLAWKYATGYAPTALRSVGDGKLDGINIFYGIDFFTGGIFSVSPSDNSGNSYQSEVKENVNVPWRLVYVAWLPYVTVGSARYDRPPLDGFFQELGGTDSDDIDEPDSDPFKEVQLLPYPTDLVISHSGKYVFVAATGLGQVIAYRRPRQDGLELEHCTSIQTTIGQYNRTRLQAPEHPKNPGVPLYSAPSKLTIDKDDRFLYVVTGSDLDECIYPATDDFGGVVMRYLIGSDCNDFILTLDPTFLVTSLDLPSHLVSGSLDGTVSGFEGLSMSVRARPARFGDLVFI